MGLIFGLTGCLHPVAGVALMFHHDKWNLIVAVSSLLGGCFLVRAGAVDYKGEWATLMGILLIVFSSAGLSSDAKDFVDGTKGEIAYEIFGFIFLTGLLLLLTGQRTNNYALEVQWRRAIVSALPPQDKPSDSLPSAIWDF